MKSVLISIRPKWCEKIANSEKTVEVRKTRPRLELPFKCYIYCTKPKFPHEDHITLFDKQRCFYAGGKVIGEFVCDNIFDCRDVPIEPTCLTVDEWRKYTDDHKGLVYGWHITGLVIYDEPRELSEFFAPCIKNKYPYCRDCAHGLQANEQRQLDGLRYVDIACGNWLKRPPQSWCYVEGGSADV